MKVSFFHLVAILALKLSYADLLILSEFNLKCLVYILKNKTKLNYQYDLCLLNLHFQSRWEPLISK